MSNQIPIEPAISRSTPDTATDGNISAESLVGQKVRELRTRRGLSLRALAERSGLNINTISLIENGKSSPSVGTLQQIGKALDFPLSAFFETGPVPREIVFTLCNEGTKAVFDHAAMQNLGKGFLGSGVQPFFVALEPHTGSGEQLIIHPGYEFVYCLSGEVIYQIGQTEYVLHRGDSILFKAHLPHCWQNKCKEESQFILILYHHDRLDESGNWHFTESRR